MKKIWGMDIFRGIAAMLVFFFHFWTFYPDAQFGIFLENLFSAGHLGVDIFFVISGFLVSLSLFRYCEKNSGVKKYFSARFRRIVPLAVLVTIVFFILKQNFSGENFLDFFAHLFFIQGFFQNFYHGINPVMWTLCVEMLFYILLPILYIFISQKKIIRLVHISIFLVLLSFFWRAFIFYFFPESSSQEKIFLSEQLWGRFDQFFLGILLAIIIFKNIQISLFLSRVFGIFGLGILGYSFAVFAGMGSLFREIFWMQVFLHSLVGFGFFLFLLGFIGMTSNNKIKEKLRNYSWRSILIPFLFLGKISYGIYLFHFPIISQVSKVFPNPLLGFFLSIFLTVFISWISWEFFEKKFVFNKK